MKISHLYSFFIIVTTDVYKVETIRFNVICQLSFQFVITERNSTFRKIFSIVTSEYSFLSTFLGVWWGLVRLVIATTARVC
jgi:hypothetical protein